MRRHHAEREFQAHDGLRCVLRQRTGSSWCAAKSRARASRYSWTTGWKIHNVSISGVWLVDTYRSQFVQEIHAKGVDGLIATLTDRNKSNAKKG